MIEHIGVVIIGRNEGDRLRVCLDSINCYQLPMVYVDSGSTDDSVELARSFGADVVVLDMSEPFTAARARNTGFRRLIEVKPDLEYVQFVDGDCELVSSWIDRAVVYLTEHSNISVICGRRRERYPDRSIYNLLCDIEWNTPVGEARSCGGDAMFRVDAFNSVGGFRNDLIAGEEPELCIRLRQAGWLIWRLDAEMTLHDADMLHFTQWWRRSVRGGYGFAKGADLFGASTERHYVRESQRAWFWGIGLPVVIGILAILNQWWGLLVFAYPFQMVRLAFRGNRSFRENWVYAFFLVLGKFPEGIGQLKYFFHQLSGKRGTLIEYK